ncbi:MAG: bifunctional adenosylcobinamide kinase/adenosylcobinamide-phosphate guanylyltransferase [Candidatus Omnitrophica bacterium]|nr:bifunctional adenosylcobinamide kinase/adenosylcobinamide-phosphate guanylyltransferase [Candidatus Omnitrophota bacterium]
MGKITFIVGGARSGKSGYAVKLAKDSGVKRVAFLATCEARDEEMKRRIALHKKARAATGWKTFEEPQGVSPLLKKIGNGYGLIIIDCLTLLVSNMMLKGRKDKLIAKEIGMMLSVLRRVNADCVIVSNEVGLGIVPENKLARDFRDVAGRINQMAAKDADEVFFMIAGIPWRIK